MMLSILFCKFEIKKFKSTPFYDFELHLIIFVIKKKSDMI